MLIKKIISASVAVILVVGTSVTTVMAQKYQHKEETYSYTYKGNEMQTMISGSTSGASTQASNSTGKYERYIEVCVTERNAETGAAIKSNASTITTKNAGTGCGIPRDYDSSKFYYVHQSLLKPSAENSYTIDSTYNEVWQQY